jgi:predicted permease
MISYPIVIAMALFLLADLLFQVGDASIYAMFISFATPAATLSSAFADQHDGDIEGAAVYTLGSTVLSVLTIPVLYWILRLIVG